MATINNCQCRDVSNEGQAEAINTGELVIITEAGWTKSSCQR